MSSFSLLSLVDILRCRYLLYTKDGESQFAFNATCDFVYNFFICEECRQHFYKMCSSVSSTFHKARDYALWLWSTHNKVNERLSKEEASLGYDYSNKKIERNQDEVYKFLTNYYGKTLASLYKDKSIVGNDRTDVGAEDLMVEATNAVVVPLGAALAIAVASCAVGALACYWRSRQKSRKGIRRDRLYSLGVEMLIYVCDVSYQGEHESRNSMHVYREAYEVHSSFSRNPINVPMCIAKALFNQPFLT
ncbi:hypothetical protein Lal_00000183 [Lupinus albus]|nr:hypothetical protein Lal_00000183 [Lupinus albus]